MSLRREVRKLFWKVGLDLASFHESPMARRKRLMESYGSDLVLDVGANAGQYGLQLRNDLGYLGRIVSFEPLSTAFRQLERKAEGDGAWGLFNVALGDRNETQRIHVSRNSQSSSLLDMLPAHLNSAPESDYVGEEDVEVRTLDSLFERVAGAHENIWLKIDTQGFEDRVIRGAERSLARIRTLQVELSLVPLYGKQLLLDEMVALLRGRGYSLVGLEPGFTDDRTGQLLQADGLFHRI